MTEKNFVSVEFLAASENEALARSVVSAVVLPADPSIEILSDIRTAVSEAVTNSIIHGYKGMSHNESGKANMILMKCVRNESTLDVFIEDYGVGIDDIERAMQPLYTSAPELERSGLGFTVMESFMDSIEVESEVGNGTKIHMRKLLNSLLCEPSENDGI
ncbi:MAG: anti-sigma F factor [Ruminococcaceae bacterium]|nr:anti-sigma F factor [Oscillospiraceae bacterium]